MYPKIIAFSGRKHSGKSMLLEHCKQRYGYQVLYFADGLKQLVCLTLGISRSTLEKTKDVLQPICIQTDLIEKEFKIKPIKNNFNSIREMMQYIGTDIIREHNPRWHIDQLHRNIRSDRICIGDCRFPNEKQFVKDLGGETWFIIRPFYILDISNHDSETSLHWSDFDGKVIINDTTKDKILEQWDKYMETGVWRPTHNPPDKTYILGLFDIIQNPFVLEDFKRYL